MDSNLFEFVAFGLGYVFEMPGLTHHWYICGLGKEHRTGLVMLLETLVLSDTHHEKTDFKVPSFFWYDTDF